MANLNGYETGNGGYRQGITYGNSPFFDPTIKSGEIAKKVCNFKGACSLIKSYWEGRFHDMNDLLTGTPI